MIVQILTSISGKIIQACVSGIDIPGMSQVDTELPLQDLVECYVFKEGELTYVEATPGPYHVWDDAQETWTLSPTAVDSARDLALRNIDTAAGKARKRYITTSPGQDATYTVKYAEALDYIAAGYPSDLSPYPFIAGESQPNTWMTPTQAATRIATIGGYWREVIGPAIEAARINGKDALDSLTDPAAIDAHVAAVVANLDAI